MRISADKSGTTRPSLEEDGVTNKESGKKKENQKGGVTEFYQTLDQIF